MAEYHNQSKLRFWCQMVLPLVYDDSLSYMELLNKVVTYLNNCIQDVGNCETNIESLLEAFVNLQDYVNEIAEDISPLIEEKIDEMIESGEFGEILADALATVVSPEYDPTESYIPLNYVIKDGTLYCCTSNTTGEWDSTKWRETTVGDELNTLMQKVYSLNAGDVSYNSATTYNSGTVGKELRDINDTIDKFRPNQLKRKWIFIGDSYGHASGSNQGWIDKLVPMLGLSASDYYQSAVGGYSFSWTGTQFITLLQNLAATITDKNAITDIVVLGGANDIGQTADTISVAIEAFNTYAYTTFPNAIVRIGMIAGCADPTKVAPQYSRTKEGYSNCGKAQYLHNLEFVFQNRDYIGPDNIHPTPTGYDVLTTKIYEALNGGCNVVYREFGTPTYPSGFNAITGASSYNVIVNNEITTITIPQRTGKIAADSSSYFAVQANVAIAVCNLPTKLFLSHALDQHSVLAATTIATVMSKVNDNFYQIKGSLFIAGNDRTVYFLPQDIILGTTSAFNSCDRISIDAVAFTAPTIMV